MRAGAGGITLLPYFEGERTPSISTARASIHGLSLENATPRNLARAFVEGNGVWNVVVALDAVTDLGIQNQSTLRLLVGLLAIAVQQILTQVTPIPVVILTSANM